MKPDSQQIIPSRCWRSVLPDTFLYLLIAEEIRWSTKYKGVIIFLDKKLEKWLWKKKKKKSLGSCTCILVSKIWKDTWLLGLYLFCISCFGIPSNDFQQLGKKSASFPFSAHHFFVFLIAGCFLFACFSSDTSEFAQGYRLGCVDDWNSMEITQLFGWHLFNTHSELKLYSVCRQKGIHGTVLCSPAKCGLLLKSHLIFP